MVKLLPFTTPIVVMLLSTGLSAAEIVDHDGILMNHGDGHLMDMDGGMVMGQNSETLPPGCDSVSETKEITVHAGHKYAEKFPGRMFAFDEQEYKFKPCTKLTVHFINEDRIRHQWMMHGLPKNIYNKGMFHLEVTGPAKISGTLILPSNDKTYLVHCDIAQHMEKGMKAQLKVGKGDGDLPSIPGLTANAIADDYNATLPELLSIASQAAAYLATQPILPATPLLPVAPIATKDPAFSGVTFIGLTLGLLLAPFLAKRFNGMSTSEVIATLFDFLKVGTTFAVKQVSNLVKRYFPKN